MRQIIDSYENYDEESRLTTNKARRVEFLTSINVMDKLISKKSKILDCAAGTGIYSFHYAEQGHEVHAYDLTPRHVEIMNEKLKSKAYLNMTTGVLNAVDMSVFKDKSFDIVLNFGPLYHLIKMEDRENCIKESLRVLKHGGLLAIAYISRFSAYQYVALSDRKYLSEELMNKIIDNGYIEHTDKDCFWTDSYYYSVDEIENFMDGFGVELVDHVATDGISPLMKDKIDNMDDNEYKIWLKYHLKTCRERSILGSSSHGLYICRKA